MLANPTTTDVGQVITNAQKLSATEIQELAHEISNLPDLTPEARYALGIQNRAQRKVHPILLNLRLVGQGRRGEASPHSPRTEATGRQHPKGNR